MIHKAVKMERMLFAVLYRYVIAIIISIFTATILLTAVYQLPIDKIRSSVSASVNYFKNEDTYPRVIADYEDTQLDYYTDALMVLMAASHANENGGGLLNAMKNAYVFVDGQNPHESLRTIYDTGFESSEIRESSYSRYWHGYLLLLKPLLSVLEYKQVIVLNYMVQMLLIFWLCGSYAKTNEEYLTVPFLGFVMFTGFFSTTLSIQFSDVFYITTIALLILHNRNIKDIGMYFLLIGVATNFFDLLTYPLVSLGVPLLYTIYYSRKQEFKKCFFAILKYSVLWSVGYGTMWAGKWIVATLITRQNVIENAIDQIFIRASYSADGSTFTFLQMMQQIFHACNSVVVVTLLLLGAFLWMKNIKNRNYDFKNLLFYIIVSFYPIIWYSVLSNHSFWHAFFTYRTLSISVVGCLFVLVCNFKDGKDVNI